MPMAVTQSYFLMNKIFCAVKFKVNLLGHEAGLAVRKA